MPVDFEEEDYSPSELASPAMADPRVGTPVTLKVPLALAGKRLDQALAELLPDYSRSRLTVMIKDGHVLLDGAVPTPKTKLFGDETIEANLMPREEELAFTPENIELDVIHEDDAIIVINKPAGLVVHPAAGNWQGTLLNGLLYRNPQVGNLPRAGIVHRLDKDTTGVMVAAKTEAAQLALVRQLQARTMKRIYTALARGNVLKDGVVDAPIGRHPRERTKMAVVTDTVRGESSIGKAAVTHYRILERFSYHSLLECSLETGRTHQIRVHMQSIGFPLEADPIYGPSMTGIDADVRRTLQAFGRQALHARKLSLEHPVLGGMHTYEAPVPDDLRDLIEFVSGL
jgi:23S rRNA pseudouridine1911/1915/1917 synthase